MRASVSIQKVTTYQVEGVSIRYEPRQEEQAYRKVIIARGSEVIGIDYLHSKFKPSRQNAAYFAAKHVNYLAFLNGETPMYINMELWEEPAAC